MSQRKKSFPKGKGFFFCPFARFLRQPLPQSLRAPAHRDTPEKASHTNAFHASRQSQKSELEKFRAARNPKNILDIQTLTHHFRQRSPARNNKPGCRLPGKTRLTQQNLCHFVAFTAFSKNTGCPTTRERIRSLSLPQNNGFVSFGSHCTPFCGQCKP